MVVTDNTVRYANIHLIIIKTNKIKSVKVNLIN